MTRWHLVVSHSEMICYGFVHFALEHNCLVTVSKLNLRQK